MPSQPVQNYILKLENNLSETKFKLSLKDSTLEIIDQEPEKINSAKSSTDSTTFHSSPSKIFNQTDLEIKSLIPKVKLVAESLKNSPETSELVDPVVKEEEDVGDNTLLELGIMASLPADNSTPLEPEAPKKQANFVKIAENELRKHVLCRNNLNKQVDLGNPANQDETDSTCEIQNENSSDATKSTLIFDSTHTETSCFESTNLTNTPTMSKSFKNSLDKIELTHFCGKGAEVFCFIQKLDSTGKIYLDLFFF